MTFHVRLVSVPDRTEELVEALAADVGVFNLLVLSGAARGPASDAILTNSQILIVGAMVVGPEYNAIMGVALGIAGPARPADHLGGPRTGRSIVEYARPG